MAGSAARVIELDAFLPPDLTIRYQGTDHRIPARILTTELVLSIQRAQEAATGDDPDEGPWLQLQEDLGALLEEEADPPLRLRDLPPGVAGVLIGSLYQNAMSLADPSLLAGDGQSPPARRPRTRSGTTTSSRSGSGAGRRAAGR